MALMWHYGHRFGTDVAIWAQIWHYGAIWAQMGTMGHWYGLQNSQFISSSLSLILCEERRGDKLSLTFLCLHCDRAVIGRRDHMEKDHCYWSISLICVAPGLIDPARTESSVCAPEAARIAASAGRR